LAGKSKGILRILTVVSIVATLSVYAVTIVSGYTSAVSFAQNAMGIASSEMQISGDPSTGITFTFLLPVQNPGLLEVTATLNLKALSAAEEVIAEGVSSKRIPPGSSDELFVSLFVPPNEVEAFARGRIFLECRTLFNLVGISLSLEGEAPSPGS